MSTHEPIASFIGKKFAEYLAKHMDEYVGKYLQQNHTGPKHVAILCTGSLYLDQSLGDWLLKMQATGISVTLHVLADKHLTERFLKSEDYKIDLSNKHWRKLANITYERKKYKIEKEVPELTKWSPAARGNKNYDIILNLYLIHNSVNWRLFLINMFSRLKKGGLFIFSEVGGSYAFLDGNFKDLPADSGVTKTFEVFDDERNEEFYFWRPEISLTNYTELKNQVEFLFDEVIDKESISAQKHPPQTANDLTENIIGFKINEGRTFRKLLDNSPFSYFLKGFRKKTDNPDKTALSLMEKVDKGKILDRELHDTLDRKDQIYICKSFNSERFKQLKERHWNYNALIKDLNHINDNRLSVLSRKALDVCISHDVFFPGYTRVISIIGWEYVVAENISFPINSVADSETVDEIAGNAQKFMLLINISGFQLLNVLFKDSRNKYSLFISVWDEADFGTCQEKGYELYSNGQEKLAFRIITTRKNKIQRMDIAINKPIVKRIMAENEQFEAWYEQNKKASELDYTSLSLQEDAISRLTITKSEKTTDPIKNVRVNCCNISHGAKPELYDRFEESILGSKPLPGTNNGHLLDWVITITVLSQLQTPGFRVGFLPSLLTITKDHANDTLIDTGLGGAIIYEKIAGNEIPLLPGLLDARDKALQEAVNIIFYKTSIESYVNKIFKRKALNSAVAAISTRSGSHTLGSHVLPEVIGKLGELISKCNLSFEPEEKLRTLINNSRESIDKAKEKEFLAEINKWRDNNRHLNNEKELFKYLQERFDFITQVIGDMPQWSLSMNYVNDLLRNFYAQYHIIDNLADTEGIRAFIYPLNKKTRELDWLNEASFENLKPRDHVAAFGYCANIDGKLVLAGNMENIYYLQKNGVAGATFPLLICEGIDPAGRSSMAEILKDAKHKEAEKKIRMHGMIAGTDGKKITINNLKLIDSKLVINARIRKYFILSAGYTKGNISNHAKIPPDDNVEGFLDIGRKKIGDSLASNGHLRYTSFLGVIESVKKFTEGGSNQYRINLFSSKKFYLVLDNTQYQNICTAFNEYRNSARDIRAGKNILCIGARLLMNGRLEQEGEDQYRIIPSSPGEQLINKISVIDHITSPYVLEADKSKKINDPEIAIPGGTVGTQAFFIILENVIRNAAKHNWIYLSNSFKAGKNLELNIELEDHNNPDFFICKVWTNTSDLRFKGAIPSNEPPTNNFMDDADNTTSMIRRFFMENLIEDDGTLRRAHLGLSEIKICAAFLAKTDWIESGFLSGPEIILNDKNPNSTGFIKCSMILDDLDGSLVPHLGYRFKILKPKEILIIGKQQGLPAGSTGITFIAGTRTNHPLDYEFCVLYDERSEKDFIKDVTTLVDAVLWGSINAETEYRIIKLSREIENYPCRLFMVTDKLNKKEGTEAVWDSFVSKFSSLEKKQQDALIFFRQRICFLSKSEFDEKLKMVDSADPKQFKNYLYSKWCRLFASRTNSYKLFVSTKIESSESKSKYHSRTVPLNLTEEEQFKAEEHDTDEHQPSGNNESIVIKRENSQQDYVIRYNRHNNDKHKDDIYCEGASGGSRIYRLLWEYERNRSKTIEAKLVENGITTIMILDERIFNYVSDKNKNQEHETSRNMFNTFQNLSIIVPYKVQINQTIIFETSEDIVKSIAADGYQKEICIEANGRKAIISFIQPKNTISGGKVNERNQYRVNSLVIHQTTLDHLRDGLYPAAKKNAYGLEPADEIVYRLKHEFMIPCVIITSGKGRSPQSSSFAKFMPFSNISDLLLRNDPDKYTLTQILLQSLNLPQPK